MIEDLERRGGGLVVAIVYYFVMERQKMGGLDNQKWVLGQWPRRKEKDESRRRKKREKTRQTIETTKPARSVKE